MNFPLNHIASLCKYTGISFTAGAITHGFFSGERSFWTAVFGIAIYLIGGTLEKIANPDKDHSWTDVLAIGIVASIGLGFFTGGLQHFPDSPARSAWVVPIGFVMSLIAMYLIEGKGKVNRKKVFVYGVIGAVIVTAASIATFSYLQGHELEHEHGHDHGAPALVGSAVAREVHIEMNDNMKFSPASWEAVQGEPIRIVVTNKGKLVHELVIGLEADLKQHLIDMKKPGFQDHHHDNEVSVKPGQTGELIWTFKQPGEWTMACLEDGHFEAGMKGVIKVAPKGR
jgi:uncharacterized cupredoxin-like copper-binding protein